MHVAVSPLPSLPLLFLSFTDRLLRRVTAPAHGSSSPAAILFDLPRSRAELVAEKALLRHQLLILNRQVKRPKLNRRDRFWLLILASRVSNRKQALLIIQPDTPLRWHRQGFRLFWKLRSHSKTNQPKLNRETIGLIRRIARENVLWGAERIQGELSWRTSTGPAPIRVSDRGYPRGRERWRMRGRSGKIVSFPVLSGHHDNRRVA